MKYGNNIIVKKCFSFRQTVLCNTCIFNSLRLGKKKAFSKKSIKVSISHNKSTFKKLQEGSKLKFLKLPSNENRESFLRVFKKFN